MPNRRCLGEWPILSFETENLLQLDDKAVIPVLLYLFRRIEQRLDGSPTLILLDEAWSYLQHELFRDRLKDWLKTMRRKNAVVVMATQQISDIANSEIADVVLENCPTKILLPNAEAKNSGSREFYHASWPERTGTGNSAGQHPKAALLRRQQARPAAGRSGCRQGGLVVGRRERSGRASDSRRRHDSISRYVAVRVASAQGPAALGRVLSVVRANRRRGGVPVRKGLIVSCLLFALAIDSPQPVEAGAFATEVTQLLNHAQLVLSYIRQGTQLANELNMYADMLKNSRNLSAHSFGAITADLNALASIVQGGQALAYSLGNLDARFRATYPGYAQTYPRNYYSSYQNWSQTSLDTTLGVLRAAGLQGQQLSSEQSILAALKSSISGTNGRLEAIQAASDIAENQVEQMQKLRQLMIADMSSKQAYQATMIQKDAASEAASQWFFTSAPVTNSGVTYWPGK